MRTTLCSLGAFFQGIIPRSCMCATISLCPKVPWSWPSNWASGYDLTMCLRFRAKWKNHASLVWRCSVIFLVKNGETKPGSKGSCLKNKRLEDKGRKRIASESLKETKNHKLMLNVTFIDEKLFILIARKVIAVLWFFVVYCFVFCVFLSRRLRIALVNVSKCVVEAFRYKGNLWPGICPSRKINRFENVYKTKLRLPNYCL